MDVSNGTVHLDVSTLQWLVYTVLPFLVDLVTKRFADGRVKAGALALFAFLTVVIQEALEAGGDISIASLAGKFVTALVTALVTHQYVWKPLRITGDRGAIEKAVPAGVGRTDPVKVVREDRRVRRGNA
jgi:hypothetical protein